MALRCRKLIDQEIAFARQVLSGAMTDRRAAEAVDLNPDSAAYTKSKPRVRAYMLDHRAAVQQQPSAARSAARRDWQHRKCVEGSRGQELKGQGFGTK